MLPEPSQIPVASRGRPASARIHLIDNFRGAALVGILLLHAVEHFSLYLFPETGPAWLLTADRWVTHLAFLFFFGKAHAVFALLFGVSYHIQEISSLRRGTSHRARMLRRMTWLFVFGLIHGLFYPGDILCMLAAYGMVLLLLARLPSRVLLVIAVLPALQPLLLIGALSGTEFFPGAAERIDGTIDSLLNDNFATLLVNNAWSNRITEWMLTLSSGRIFQIGAWMLAGIAAGRSRWFEDPQGRIRIHQVTFLAGVILYLALAMLFSDAQGQWATWLARVKETVMVVMMVSGALLLATRWQLLKAPTVLSTYGRMSLTNYVTQGILGSMLFYGYGLGLYQLGATLSVLVGAGILGLQMAFSTWWAARHARGPLEELWARLATRPDRVGTQGAS